jgi:response regulator of citrate/malate metabolism
MKTIDDYKLKIAQLEDKILLLEANSTCSIDFNIPHSKIPSLKFMERDLKIFAKNAKILIIADTFEDSICQNSISSFAIVTKVHNFEEAKTSMNKTKYDIVIISGIEKISILESLRILNPDIFALFITSVHSDQLFLKLIEVGIDGFLYYPFSKEQFVHQLMTVAEKLMYKNLLRKYEIDKIVKEEVAKVESKIKKDVLMNNVKYKVSAKDFLQSFKDTPAYDKVMDDLDDFIKISEDFEGIMYDVIENDIFDDNILEESVHYFTEAEKIIFNIGSFDEIGLAFGELIIIYEKQNKESVIAFDTSIYKAINAMQHDLMKLLKGIFIKEDLLDINYLDDFFVNNIYKIKEELGLATNNVDDDPDLKDFLL